MSPRTLGLRGGGSPGTLPVQRMPTQSPATVAEPIRPQRGKSRDVDEDQLSSATDVRTWLLDGHGPRLERGPRGTQSFALYSVRTAKLNNSTRDRIVVNDSHARLARGSGHQVERCLRRQLEAAIACDKPLWPCASTSPRAQMPTVTPYMLPGAQRWQHIQLVEYVLQHACVPARQHAIEQSRRRQPRAWLRTDEQSG